MGVRISAFISKIFYLDLRSLAVFRIGLGLISLYNLFAIYPDINAFFGANGIAPLSAFKADLKWSVYCFSDHFYFIRCLFILHVIFSAMLVVGFQTRLATILCWIMTVSLINRLPIVIYGADNVMQVFLMWGAFLPLGARFSLDSCIGSKYKKSTNHFISMATIAFICQLIIIYVLTSLERSHLCWTQEYTALYYIFSDHEYAKPFATWLLIFPRFLQLLTFLSILLELYVVFLLIMPIFSSFFRGVVVALFLIFHLFMYLTLNLDWFPFVMIACWTALIPSSWWQKLSLAESSNIIVGINFRKVVDSVVSLILCYVLIVNFHCIGMKKFHQEWRENSIEDFGRILGIYQKWNMFSLDNPEWTGRHYIYFVDAKSLSKNKSNPVQFLEIPKTKRWEKILGSINLKEQSKHLKYLKQYLVTYWKKKYSIDVNINLVRVEYHREKISIP